MCYCFFCKHIRGGGSKKRKIRKVGEGDGGLDGRWVVSHGTLTATATDPPPANSPIIHSVTVGWFTVDLLQKSEEKKRVEKIIEKENKTKVVSLKTNISLQDTGKWVF